MHSSERTFPLNSSLLLALPSGVKNVGGLSLLDLAVNRKINMQYELWICISRNSSLSKNLIHFQNHLTLIDLCIVELLLKRIVNIIILLWLHLLLAKLHIISDSVSYAWVVSICLKKCHARKKHMPGYLKLDFRLLWKALRFLLTTALLKLLKNWDILLLSVLRMCLLCWQCFISILIQWLWYWILLINV